MMHKIVLSIALISLTIGTFAQNTFHIGAAAAPTGIFILKQNNFGVLQEDEFSDPTVRKSELAYLPYFGFTAEVNFGYFIQEKYSTKTPKFGVQSALIYSKQGQHYEDFMFERTAQGNRKQVNRNVDLTYLQIPFLFNYYKGRKQHKFYTSAGPQFGFLIIAKEEIFIDGELKNYDITEEQKFRKFDFGLALNLGYQYHFADNFFLNVGWHNYVGAIDLNGQYIRDLGWFSKNDTQYRKSRNFRTGLNVGISYVIGNQRRY